MRWVILLLASLTAGVAQAPRLTAEQGRDVFHTIAEALHEHFYDETLSGLDWDAVEEEYLPRFESAENAPNLRDLTRELLNLLDASHTLVSSRSEREEFTSNILPLVFERVGGRVFVSDVLIPNSGTRPPIVFGDEILAVDGNDPSDMQPYTLRFNRSPVGNPYLGRAGSMARVRLRRAGRELTVALERGQRWSGFEMQTLRRVPGNVAVLRSLSIGEPERLVSLLAEAFEQDALILDLRNNGGGIDQASQPLLSALLGPGKEVSLLVPRETGAPLPVRDYDADPPDYAVINDLVWSGHRVRMLTYEFEPRYNGPVAVLIGPNTQSQAELVAAVLKHHGRATLYGRRTAGAMNGSQFGVRLPHGVGAISVPWHNTAFGGGKVYYEGIGVPPDVAIRNSARDFLAGRDRVMEAALADFR